MGNGREARIIEQRGLAWGVVVLTVLLLALPASAIAGRKSAQQCARLILRHPQLLEAKMFHPGAAHQESIIKLHYPAVEGCGNWQRESQLKEEVKRSGRWISMEGPAWFPVGLNGPKSNEAHDAGFVLAATTHIYDECVNGHREPVRIRVRNLTKNRAANRTQKIGKTKTWPVKVEGGC